MRTEESSSTFVAATSLSSIPTAPDIEPLSFRHSTQSPHSDSSAAHGADVSDRGSGDGGGVDLRVEGELASRLKNHLG